MATTTDVCGTKCYNLNKEHMKIATGGLHVKVRLPEQVNTNLMLHFVEQICRVVGANAKCVYTDRVMKRQ
jgi:hypothetical protein